MHLSLAFVLSCTVAQATMNIHSPFIHQFCEVLFNSHTDCPSPFFIKVDLICFVGNNSLPNQFLLNLKRINRNKNSKITACREWPGFMYTIFNGQKCVEKRTMATPLNGHTTPYTDTTMDMSCSSTVKIHQVLANIGYFTNAQTLTEAPLPTKNGEDMKERFQSKTSLAKKVGKFKLVPSYRNITLHQACQQGKLEAVKYILFKKLEDIECRGKWNRTPIIEAAAKGQMAVFDFLIGKGCDLSAVDEYNNNVFHVACRAGHINIVKTLLIREHFDVESRGGHNWTPVMHAAFFGKKKIVDLLMSEGSELTVVGDGNNTILHVACLGGHVDMVKYILSLHLHDIESKGNKGRSPVMIAAEHGHKDIFEVLIFKGCNRKVVDVYGNNMLHLACSRGHINLVTNILKLNAVDIDSRGAYRRTPVMMAAENAKIDVVGLLLSRGCNRRALDENGNNILHAACMGGNVDMVKYLVSLRWVKGMRTRKNKFRRTPLQLAKVFNHQLVVAFLKSKE